MDPVILLALRSLFALMLASAASHKLRDPARFRAVLAAYEVVPAQLVAGAAWMVAGIESLLALMVGFGAFLPLAGVGIALLMVTYAAAIEWNIRRGRADIDCGCMGPSSRVPLGRGLVYRNLVLALSAAFFLAPVSLRSLGWLDFVTTAFALATVSACWLASQRMLALAPRAAELRRRTR